MNGSEFRVRLHAPATNDNFTAEDRFWAAWRILVAVALYAAGIAWFCP